MKIKLIQLDGSLPNLALMKLSYWFKQQGHIVDRSISIYPSCNEECYDLVFGSAIFKFSENAIKLFKHYYPNGILGGTGTENKITVEDYISNFVQIGNSVSEKYDYEIYPEFKESIGFTQRGCRLSCKFCVVPTKEGKPKSVNTIYDIWRGGSSPKKLHLLDNDFFGNPQWRDRLQEIKDGKFRICLSQGINVRLINKESAESLASIQYRNTRFNERKLYTAWDNLHDEKIFFEGVETLEQAGIPPKHLMAYMLVGYDKTETWERIWYRFLSMTSTGIEPYPMVFDRTRSDLISFQRWACRGLYRIVPWNEYVRRTRSEESTAAWYRIMREYGLETS